MAAMIRRRGEAPARRDDDQYPVVLGGETTKRGRSIGGVTRDFAGGALAVLEELNRPLVLLGGLSGLEGSEVPALARPGIELPRIQTVLSRAELSNHGVRAPSIPSGRWPSIWCSRGPVGSPPPRAGHVYPSARKGGK